jgi:hypothetical protein
MSTWRAHPPGGHLGDHRAAHDEQLESQLPAAERVLDRAVLDRIDQVVAPGLAIDPPDTSYPSPADTAATQRR